MHKGQHIDSLHKVRHRKEGTDNEKVLSDNGKIDPAKLNALIFDQFQNGYYVAAEKVGKAWNAGADLMKK